ncbi:hypothetical protein EBR03_02705 [bacterium]|nr:hypothetical protein [bacterium]
MLDILRKKKEHWISAFIVLAVAVVMAFFGVSKFNDSTANPNQPVAWVNGEVISQRDFSRELEFTLNQYRSMLGAQYDEKMLAAFQIPQRTLERMIQFKVLCQQAEKMGFSVSDTELADHIRTLPYFQKDGKFDAALYSQIPNRGIEERKQREQMTATRLQTYLTQRIKPFPADRQVSDALKNTQVELEFAAIDFNQLAPQKAPDPKLLQELTDNTQLLAQQYEARKKEFTEPARYHFRQIRAGAAFQAPEEIRRKAQAKLETLKKELTPENFSQKAQTVSDDEFAKKGGDRGWVAQGLLDPQLEKVIERLAPQQVSEVIDTPSGFFLIQLLEKTEPVVKPLEAVKEKLVADLAREQSKNKWVETLRKEWEQQLLAGKSLTSEFQKYKIPVKKTGKFSLEKGTIPSIGASEPMLDGLFELSLKAPVAKRFYFYQDKYYTLKLVSLNQSRPKTEKEDPASNAVNVLQRELFESWVSGLEKQASIKLGGPFQDKGKKNAATL